MRTPQEILAEWADPETGGTMPREVRDAALSVLTEIERLREALEPIAAQVCAAAPFGRPEGCGRCMSCIARAALRGKP